MRRTALLLAAVALLLAIAPGSPAAAYSPPAAPAGLAATPYWNHVALSWQPGGNPADVIFYRVRNLTFDRESTTIATGYSWSGGIEENQTYTFEVTAVNDDGESPGSRVTVTTPSLGPPTSLTAALAGDTITFTWNRPAAVDPSFRIPYVVRLSGVVETVHMTGGHQLTLSIPRVNPGRTHVYTVQVLKGVIAGLGPESSPAPLAVPPSADTTPPTVPEWVIGSPPECELGHEITVESVDDTTPQSEIRYEGINNLIVDGPHETFVHDYHLPIKSEPGVGPPAGIRAVDEAGNRSAARFGADGCA
jgi:hypothetical protein